MPDHTTSYQSYLLRMWKESEDGEWRAVLLSIPTQERRHFPNLQALFEFLTAQKEIQVNLAPATSMNANMITFSK